MEPLAHTQSAPGIRRRARDLGIIIGRAGTGPLNAITDVPGVRVGHTTVRRRPDVHSGVTAIMPGAVGRSRGTTGIRRPAAAGALTPDQVL